MYRRLGRKFSKSIVAVVVVMVQQQMGSPHGGLNSMPFWMNSVPNKKYMNKVVRITQYPKTCSMDTTVRFWHMGKPGREK
jgi:hypothetical protein